jgi:hypothetical protein
MRISIRGPSLGPVHTTLWSSGHRSHSKGKGTVRLWLFTVTFVTIGAYQASPVLGAGSTVLFAVIAALAVRKAWKAL